jgi:ubiquinone/menaquinone biosynthesis C-methylase UbiE
MRNEALLAKKTWDTIGAQPDGYINAWDAQSHNAESGRERQRLAALLEKHQVFRPDTNILDIACGKGTLLAFMQPKIGRTGMVTELDVSAAMLAGAQAKAQELGMAGQVECIQADAQESQLPAAVFDLVIIFNALPHFKSDIPGLMHEVSRVLKPGGILVIMHSMSRLALNQVHQERAEFKEDLVPSINSLVQAFGQNGLQTEEWVDAPSIDYLLIKARKSTR